MLSPSPLQDSIRVVLCYLEAIVFFLIFSLSRTGKRVVCN
uniref:Uncharacterized protein n=1 Tax=Arundo donax TaxID=35708 RepID=A0A0A9FUF3_ARUDO